jgi:hypothetical protein
VQVFFALAADAAAASAAVVSFERMHFTCFDVITFVAEDPCAEDALSDACAEIATPHANNAMNTNKILMVFPPVARCQAKRYFGYPPINHWNANNRQSHTADTS